VFSAASALLREKQPESETFGEMEGSSLPSAVLHVLLPEVDGRAIGLVFGGLEELWQAWDAPLREQWA
jgi:hypothetical protein